MLFQLQYLRASAKAAVPYQTYANRSDIAGGSTLGNISDSHVSINTIDIGLAQLAMHSAYETAGVKDTTYMIEALMEFLIWAFKAAATSAMRIAIRISLKMICMASLQAGSW